MDHFVQSPLGAFLDTQHCASLRTATAYISATRPSSPARRTVAATVTLQHNKGAHITATEHRRGATKESHSSNTPNQLTHTVSGTLIAIASATCAYCRIGWTRGGVPEREGGTYGGGSECLTLLIYSTPQRTKFSFSLESAGCRLRWLASLAGLWSDRRGSVGEVGCG